MRFKDGAPGRGSRTISNESLATEIKARVYFNEPEKSKVFEQFFDKIWEAVGAYQINREYAP